PLVLWSDFIERGVGKASDRRLDTVRLDVRAVGPGVRLGFYGYRHFARGWRNDLRSCASDGRVQKRPGHEAEAGRDAHCTGDAGQRTLPRMNSMKVPVGTPVGPLGIVTRSVSEYAVPAMSRCAHAYPSANSF